MVADTRNDSHALLSQLTVLFHLLHNTLIDTGFGHRRKQR